MYPASPAAPAARFAARQADWRCGAVVYQVLVDRFAPSGWLAAKRGLYAAPKVLRPWDETPARGRYLDREQVWSHELEFWGGDLASLRTRLDHVQALGAEVLYLNPIHQAWTNHKYDAQDYKAVSPEYGTRHDAVMLAEDLHQRGMKLVLDGVFNHMGRRSPLFEDAASDPANAYRDWFVFGSAYPGGARTWQGVANLPELNLESPALREHLFDAPESVVRGWLRDGVDGWRLDVAFELGVEVLQALTWVVHDEKPGSLVVGEIPNYPADWFPAVDGVLLFGVRRLLLALADGSLDGHTAGRMLGRLIGDCGVDNLLRSWLYLDNHDTERLASALPDERRRRVAQLLQFTLPGSPCLYYGSEVGMTGTHDPEMRGPMRWDHVDAGHPELAWTQQLMALRQRRALKVGDYCPITTRELFAFERHTERVLESVFVVANAGPQPVDELLLIANSGLMDGTPLVDLLGQVPPVTVHAALARVTVPPHTVLVLVPEAGRSDGYSSYKRVA